VISNQAKTLRKLISKRTNKLADTVHSVTGVEKESLNRMKLAEQLKTTMNNGKKMIRSFDSPNLKCLHQNSERSKASQRKVTRRVTQPLKKGYLSLIFYFHF
jgi:hypothetical protein